MEFTSNWEFYSLTSFESSLAFFSFRLAHLSWIKARNVEQTSSKWQRFQWYRRPKKRGAPNQRTQQRWKIKRIINGELDNMSYLIPVSKGVNLDRYKIPHIHKMTMWTKTRCELASKLYRYKYIYIYIYMKFNFKCSLLLVVSRKMQSSCT